MTRYKKKTKMDEIHELGIQLRDEQLQNTHLSQKCSDLADECAEQRQKFIMFLHYMEGYPVQYTPGLRAEIENMITYFSK